ncbi:P-II family nitrogen regulator [Chloroflexota bacterium]
MAYWVVLVLDDPDRTRDVLDAWEAAGAPGVTIMDSSGLGRVRLAGIRDDMPLMPSLGDLFRRQEDCHRTLFSVVKDQSQVEAIAEATQAVIGELDRGHTGLLFAVPISQVFGLNKKRESD